MKKLSTVTIAMFIAEGCGGGPTQVVLPPPPPPGTFQVSFSSYIGGSGLDMVRDVTTDGSGNIYLVGSAESANFPTTSGTVSPGYHTGGNPLSDAFVTKLSPSGAILWSTFIGGPNFDRAYAVELDPQGNIITAGRAGAGFPTTAGVLQPNFGGGMATSAHGTQDGHICKLTPNGASIIWCTYLGTGDQGFFRDVAVDQNGDIFVAGPSMIGGFPAAWFTGTVQPVKGAGQDAFLAKVSGDGTRVIWATYIGGSGDEAGAPSVRVDAQGNPIVLFDTDSPDLPTTHAAQPSYGGGQDMYVVKLSSDGRTRIFATYLGGSGPEGSETHGLWVDQQGNVIVAAQTGSTNFPLTAGAYQSDYAGGPRDAFVVKLSSTGTLLASTLLGGPGNESIEGVVTDAQGNVFVMVSTNGSFPTTEPAIGPGGGADAVAVKLSPSLGQLLAAVRIGGTGNEETRTAFLDPQGAVLMAGQTSSTNWPVLGPFQASNRGGFDGFITRLFLP